MFKASFVFCKHFCAIRSLGENAVHNTYISSYEGFKAKLEGQGFKECQKRVSITAIVGKPMVVSQIREQMRLGTYL